MLGRTLRLDFAWYQGVRAFAGNRTAFSGRRSRKRGRRRERTGLGAQKSPIDPQDRCRDAPISLRESTVDSCSTRGSRS